MEHREQNVTDSKRKGKPELLPRKPQNLVDAKSDELFNHSNINNAFSVRNIIL